jgi:hypothetical protein
MSNNQIVRGISVFFFYLYGHVTGNVTFLKTTQKAAHERNE